MVPIDVVAIAAPLASKANSDDGVPLMRVDPRVVVATTCPAALVERSPFDMERLRFEVDAVAK